MFKYITGSRLYGYNGDNSDIDYKVVQAEKKNATREFLNKKKIDTVYWTYEELTDGILKGNPYLVEALFIPKEFILDGFLLCDTSLNIQSCVRGYKTTCFSMIEDAKFLTNCESCPATKIARSFLTQSYRIYYDLTDLVTKGEISYPKSPEQLDFLRGIKTGDFTGSDVKRLSSELLISLKSIKDTL